MNILRFTFFTHLQCAFVKSLHINPLELQSLHGEMAVSLSVLALFDITVYLLVYCSKQEIKHTQI